MECRSSEKSSLAIKLHLDILEDLGLGIQPPACILDYGCGEGDSVEAFRQLGFECFGCDIVLSDIVLNRPNTKVKLIGNDLKIPFANNSFDFVFSDQVLEHVQDHQSAFAEISRVLKPGGVSLHIFPAKWRPLEAHEYIPLGGVFQNYWWCLLWAYLGIRNEFKTHTDYRQAAAMMHQFLKTSTKYLSGSELIALAEKEFTGAQFVEKSLLKNAFGRARKIFPLVKIFPILPGLYSTFFTRALLCRKDQNEQTQQNIINYQHGGVISP